MMPGWLRLLNGFLREPEYVDTSGLPPGLAEAVSTRNEGLVPELYDLRQTHTTIVMFEGIAAKLRSHYDHVHSYLWFSEQNIRNDVVLMTVASEVAIERHTGGVANYLFADGHVEAISADQIAQWCDEEFNFALPQQF